MLRWVLFSTLLLNMAQGGEPTLKREGNRWVTWSNGAADVSQGVRVRITGGGAVELAPSPTRELRYSAKLSVKAHRESEARARLGGEPVRLVRQGEWLHIAAPMASWLRVEAPPAVREAVVWSADGSLNIGGLMFPVHAQSGGGPIFADNLKNPVQLSTGAGDIRIGTIYGDVRATTAVGRIEVGSIHGAATLESGGGDITAQYILGTVRATTVGGTVRIGRADGTVVARSGGGPVDVGRAAGQVSIQSLAGPVQVGSAPGVQCESAAGGIRLTSVSGSIRASTAMGSIVASLLAGRPIHESFLSTANGDITVYIPSNLGVTVRAANELADSLRRIVSEFPAVPVRLQGTQVVAEGAINGGGPVLRINGTNGTIYIKRQP